MMPLTQEIWKMHCAGKSVREIRETVGVPTNIVHRHLKMARESTAPKAGKEKVVPGLLPKEEVKFERPKAEYSNKSYHE